MYCGMIYFNVWILSILNFKRRYFFILKKYILIIVFIKIWIGFCYLDVVV